MIQRSLLTIAALLVPLAAYAAETKALEQVPQAVAYYFPCWHRLPEQKGESLGEWPSIASATPRFEGHLQPKHPIWGIEDESDPQVMAKKIATAADHGLSAFIFCWYYHEQGGYLDRALHEGYLRAANKTRLPFALMWANHDVNTQPFDQPHTGAAGYPDTPVLIDNTPAHFRNALLEAKARAQKLPPGQRIVTIYAWNEWTEGGYLEPEATTGTQYLEAVREVFGQSITARTSP